MTKLSSDSGSISSHQWNLPEDTQVSASSEMGILATGNVLVPADAQPLQPSLTQAEVDYVEKTAVVTEHCSICRHYLGAGICELVKPEPKPIMDQGWCSRYSDAEVDVKETEDVNRHILPAQTIKEQDGMETKGFIYLSIRWVWEIERIQSAFYTLFGYDLDWDWYSAYTYHITLAYAENVSDEQLMEAAKAALGTSGFSVKFVGLGTFPAGDDKKTLYAKVEDNENLRALQRAVYDSLVAQGVTVSEFDQPDGWIPHMSVALVPAETVVPEAVLDAVLDAYAYCDTLVLGRDNYQSLATVTLKWNETTYINPDEGLTPAASPALESAKLSLGIHPDYEIVRGEGAWDANAAVKAALESIAYGEGKSASALSMLDGMFLVKDIAAPSLMTSYRHPFAELKDGKVVVTTESLRSAAASLAQDKDLSKDAIEIALTELNHYKEKIGVGEMSRVRLTMISEMKGDYPNITLPESVDLAALEETFGEKPLFVTLPIGQFGARSNNQRTYSEQAVRQVVEQINDQRPYGGWGHLNEEEFNTDFDPPAVQWLAAVIDEYGVAWGKFIPLNKETRDYYKTAKALGSKVATSLVAFAEMAKDIVLSLELKMIDIADPARIGVSMTVAQPLLANEMAMGDVFVKTRTTAKHEAQKPTHGVQVQEQVAAAESGASSEVTRGIEGTSVPAANQSEVENKGKKKMLTEMEIQALQESAANATAKITELQAANTVLTEQAGKSEAREAALVAELNVLLGEYLVAEIEREVTVPAFRGMVKKQVLARKPQNRDEIKAAVREFLDDPDNQEAMKGQVALDAGPNQTAFNRSLHTTEQNHNGGSGGGDNRPEQINLSHFEFDPVDPASARAS